MVAAGEEDFIANQLGRASKDDFMIKYFGDKNGSAPFNVLLVYFQYSNLDNKPDTYDPTWCNKIEAILATANHGGSLWERFKLWVEQMILNLIVTRDNSKITRISDSITRLWTFEGTREFNYPFLKYGQVTDKVASPDWSEWAATRIDEMTGRSEEGLMAFVQCQNFGGQNSAVTKNGRRNQTAYAWRNTTVGYNLDIFYNRNKPNAQENAQDWHRVNLAEGVGSNGKFSTTDHRWFWASHDNTNMHEVWQYYYSEEDYEKCCKVKVEVDPNGVFTPNSFVVGYTPNSAPKHLALNVTPVTEATGTGQPE